MPRLSTTTPGNPKTNAGRVYWANSLRSARLVQVVVKAGLHFAQEFRELARSGITEADNALSDRLNGEFDLLEQGASFMHEWNAVMVVTFAETFLHDVLVEAAQLDSTILGDAEPKVSYADISVVESLAELRVEALSRWARGFVDDGGPSRWSSRLLGMGVRGHDSEIGTLEELWGIRHAVVHRAGVVSAEFLRRHPGLASRVGEKLSVSPERVNGYIESVDRFVDAVDSAFAGRLRAKQASVSAV